MNRPCGRRYEPSENGLMLLSDRVLIRMYGFGLRLMRTK